VTSGMDYPDRCCAIACADVATAKAKLAAIILIIVYLPGERRWNTGTLAKRGNARMVASRAIMRRC